MPWPEADRNLPRSAWVEYTANHYTVIAGSICAIGLVLYFWRPIHPRAVALKKSLLLSIRIYLWIMIPLLLVGWITFWRGHPLGLLMQVMTGIGVAPFFLPSIAIITVAANQLLCKKPAQEQLHE